MFDCRTEVQQCSLRGLRVPKGPLRVTDQPNGWKFLPPEYEINDNLISPEYKLLDKLKNKNDLTLNILKVKEYLDPGRDS